MMMVLCITIKSNCNNNKLPTEMNLSEPGLQDLEEDFFGGKN